MNARRLSFSVELFDPFVHPIEDGKEHSQMVRVHRRRFRGTGVRRWMNVGSWNGRFRMAIPSTLVRVGLAFAFFEVVERVVAGDEPATIDISLSILLLDCV